MRHPCAVPTATPRLPKQLQPIHIARAVDYIEGRAAEFVDLYYEQANIFSAIVGMLGVLALDSLSPYKKHKHPDVAQQRFPDLSLGGRLNPPPDVALESKGSTRPWAVQSHYDHPGWYVIWRYHVDPTKQIKPGCKVVVWSVDVVYFAKADWKYEKSKASAEGGGRTHTFGIVRPADKLRTATAYSLPNVMLRGGRPVLIEVS
jgi:hypothetical protein